MPPEVHHVTDEISRCDAVGDSPRSVCAVELLLADGAPDWVELIPAGEFTPRDGRQPWVNDDPDAVIAATRDLAMDLPIDYDHQIDLAPENGRPAPAAGWIKELAVRAGAIWGRVEWTERARAMLAAKEYRFLSPVFTHTVEDRTVLQIWRAALTNNPALHLTALTTMEVSAMDPKLKKVLDLLGLTEKTPEDELAKAVSKLLATSTAMASVREALKLGDDVSADDIQKAIATAMDSAGTSKATDLSAIAKAAGLDAAASAEDIQTAVAKAVSANAPDPNAFVPRAEFDQVRSSLASLQKQGAESKANAAVDGAIAEGKITPAMRDWAVDYCASDPDGFDNYVEGAPVIVKPGPSDSGKRPKKGDGPLDEAERAVCAAMGLDEETFKKSRTQLEEEIAQ